MAGEPLNYASSNTPHRSPAMYWFLGAIDVLLGCMVIVVVPLAMIAGSVLLLLGMWLIAIVVLALIPLTIVGGIGLSDIIGRARRKIAN